MENTNYRGSTITAALVEQQIHKRFGKDTQYDPLTNCRTYLDWQKNGYQVKHGEKAIKSYTFYTLKTKQGEEKKVRKTINLFYYTQVQKI